MKLKMELRGGLAYFPAGFDKREWALFKGLQEALSSPVAGAEFRGRGGRPGGAWNGREYLLQLYGGVPAAPMGLLPRIAKELKRLGSSLELEWVDSRPVPDKWGFEVEYTGKPLRDYQVGAVNAATKDRGAMTCRGCLTMSIRSGKTEVMAAIIAKMRVPTLFMVPSVLLLRQTAARLEASLRGPTIGICGEQIWQPGDVTVATVQTLLARPAQGIPLARRSALIVGDEGHHFKSPAWRQVMLTAAAPYQLVLSGSLWFNPDEPQNEANIWISGIVGPVLYNVPVDKMIRAGYLKRPKVLVFTCGSRPKNAGDSWNTYWDAAIPSNLGRNSMIADLATHCSRLGLRTLIDTGRKKQVKQISEMIGRRGQTFDTLVGNTPEPIFKRTMSRLNRGESQGVISTVLGEGVDIPSLEVVINAEGGKSKVAMMQRMRNLTAIDGKGDVLVIDFMDAFSPKMIEHSEHRLVFYGSHQEFDIQEIPMIAGKTRIPRDIAESILAGKGRAGACWICGDDHEPSQPPCR